MSYLVQNVYGKIKNKTAFVSVPGSKSITARALLIAAIAEGESTLCGVQFSDDCLTFLNCLKELGIKCEADGTTVKITGCGGVLENEKAEINVGSAGTAARFLPAFLAFQKGEYKLNCSDQMKRRPISPLIKTLESLGANFTFLEEENSYPFIIKGTPAPKKEIEVDINESSQFLSALLISAVCALSPLKINVTGTHGLDYVNMTRKMMRSFGVETKERNGVFTFVKKLTPVCNYDKFQISDITCKYTARNYEIEPDVSAACYFYAMNKILGTDISVNGIDSDSLQGDINFIKILKSFDGGKIDMHAFSDQTLTLAAIAPYLSKPTEICNVAHIRKQECDRISAIVQNLTAMGVKCEERADGVKIYPSQPKPAKIQTFGDHRVAMSFAVTGLRADGIEILNPEVCSKTFKEYFEVLTGLCKTLTE